MAALTILPDAVSIKTRFTEFTTVDDSAIGFAIEEAARAVDDTWAEGDQLIAVSLLAAHIMAVASASSGVDGRAVISETIGPISVTYAQVQSASQGAISEKGTTSYGTRYLSMLRKNFSGPIAVV